MLEIVGTIVGLIYLWLEYKDSIYLWITGIIMPAIYLSVYYKAGLYADFGINIYYLLAAIYGWIMWRYGSVVRSKILKQKAEREVKELPITHVPWRYLFSLSLVFACALVGIAFILIRFTDSNVPWLDSFTTAMSIIGMWMLAKKYVEQWFAWMAVDAVSAGLYIYKELYFTSALYALYTVIAVFGYYKWIKLMKTSEEVAS